MTISTTSSGVTYIGNNSTTVFSFNFVAVSASDVTVLFNNNGVVTTLSPSQYTLFLNPPATGALWGVGGTVTYPKVGSPITNQQSITIDRTLPLTQLSSISNQGDFYPTVVEEALDTLCMQIQQVSARTGQLRGVWTTGTAYNFGDIVQDGVNGSNTGNYYTCVIANTSGTWATDLSNGDWSLSFNLQQAQTYATAAANSATAAAASASSAAASATTATTQAGIATTQATNASASASSASTSATNASTSATNAANSASSSSTSATSASNSASTATTQATNAAASATAAAASATQAASIFSGTSTTSNTIGTGALTFTTQTNLGFAANEYVIVAHNASNYVIGTVTSYNNATGSLVINGTATLGSGTFTSWTIGLTGQPGTGTGTVTSVTFTGDGTVLSSTPSSAVTTSGTVAATLANAGAKTILGNTTSGSAAPTYTSSPVVSGSVTANNFVSTVATGTAPFTVSSTTQVANLNAATAGNATTVTNGVYTTDTGTVTNTMLAGSIALSKLANQAADTFLANATGGSAAPTAVALGASQLAGRGSTGDIAAISLGSGLSMSGTTLSSTVTGGLTLGTPTATTSGTAINYSGLPAGIKQIIMNFNAVGKNATSLMLVRMGPVGGVQTTGYLAADSDGPDYVTNGFPIRYPINTYLISGSLVFTLLDATNNIWCLTGSCTAEAGAHIQFNAGQVTLTGALSIIQLTSAGGDTFNAGSINIAYQ